MESIENVRPLIGLRSPLRVLPRTWLEMIEPKIRRPKDTPCWIWQGAINNDGEPVLMVRNPETGLRKSTLAKRLIAALFWDMKPYWEVIHACKVQNCLNPRHFLVTAKHWSHQDRNKVVNKMAQRIRAWARELK